RVAKRSEEGQAKHLLHSACVFALWSRHRLRGGLRLAPLAGRRLRGATTEPRPTLRGGRDLGPPVRPPAREPHARRADRRARPPGGLELGAARPRPPPLPTAGRLSVPRTKGGSR